VCELSPKEENAPNVKRLSGQASNAALAEVLPDTLLTATDIGEWLKVSPRQVQRLGIPWIDLGRKTRRYQVRDVLAWLETRRRQSGR